MNDQWRKDDSIPVLKKRLRAELAAQFDSIHRRRSRLRVATRAGVVILFVGLFVAVSLWNPSQKGNGNAPGGELARAVSPDIRNGSNDVNAKQPIANQYSSMTVEFLSDADVEKLLAENKSDWFIAKVNGEVRAFNTGKNDN